MSGKRIRRSMALVAAGTLFILTVAFTGCTIRVSQPHAGLVWVSDMPGIGKEIFLYDADGDNQTYRLTNNTALDDQPVFQYKDTLPTSVKNRIAYVSDRDGVRNIFFALMDGTMTQGTNLTHSSLPEGEPAYSTQGLIAFCVYEATGTQIVVIDPAHSTRNVLTAGPYRHTAPAWSPDGSRIAYLSDETGNQDIWLMNADGSGQTPLTTNPYNDFSPVWSPNGSRIAFVSERDGNHEIYIMSASGGTQTRLTNNTWADTSPCWTYGSDRIVYVSDLNWTNREIFIMNADGSGKTNLTNSVLTRDESPIRFYIPDNGEYIIYTSDPAGTREIYSMLLNGSAKTRRTNNTWEDTNPICGRY